MALPKILKENFSIPVMGAPLFIISNPDLVLAQCKAGVLGSFPALNARPQTVLDEIFSLAQKDENHTNKFDLDW